MKTQVIAIILVVVVICFIIWAIFTQLKEHASKNEPKILELKRIMKPLYVYEGFKLDLTRIRDAELMAGNKSYTINKHKVYLCLKDENGNYYNNNMLIYVLIHEYAHVLCDEKNHTEKFWNIFEDLLLLATELGIYNPSIPIIHNYCER